jgi:hypothetical protein
VNRSAPSRRSSPLSTTTPFMLMAGGGVLLAIWIARIPSRDA